MGNTASNVKRITAAPLPTRKKENYEYEIHGTYICPAIALFPDHAFKPMIADFYKFIGSCTPNDHIKTSTESSFSKFYNDHAAYMTIYPSQFEKDNVHVNNVINNIYKDPSLNYYVRKIPGSSGMRHLYNNIAYDIIDIEPMYIVYEIKNMESLLPVVIVHSIIGCYTTQKYRNHKLIEIDFNSYYENKYRLVHDMYVEMKYDRALDDEKHLVYNYYDMYRNAKCLFVCKTCYIVRKTDVYHCCKCRIHFPSQHCCACHIIYAADKRHCCKCNTLYPTSDNQKHCCKCNTCYVENKHCCKCKINYNEKHCCECKMNYDDKHCCKCKLNYSHEHCCKCEMNHDGKHCCKCKVNYTGKHCCKCKLNYDKFHCCKCKSAYDAFNAGCKCANNNKICYVCGTRDIVPKENFRAICNRALICAKCCINISTCPFCENGDVKNHILFA